MIIWAELNSKQNKLMWLKEKKNLKNSFNYISIFFFFKKGYQMWSATKEWFNTEHIVIMFRLHVR